MNEEVEKHVWLGGVQALPKYFCFEFAHIYYVSVGQVQIWISSVQELDVCVSICVTRGC